MLFLVQTLNSGKLEDFIIPHFSAYVDIGIVDTEQYERSDYFFIELSPPIWAKKMNGTSNLSYSNHQYVPESYQNSTTLQISQFFCNNLENLSHFKCKNFTLKFSIHRPKSSFLSIEQDTLNSEIHKRTHRRALAPKIPKITIIQFH